MKLTEVEVIKEEHSLKGTPANQVIVWQAPDYKGVDLDVSYWEKQTATQAQINTLASNEPDKEKLPSAQKTIKFFAGEYQKLAAGKPAHSAVKKPILVTPKGSGYLVVDGNHRFFGARASGIEKVNVVIIPKANITVRTEAPPEDEQVQHTYPGQEVKEVKLSEKPTEPQGDTDEMIVLDYRARIKALQDIQSDTEIVRDPDLKQAVLIGRKFLAKWREAWINANPERGILFNKMRFESEEEIEDKEDKEDIWVKNFKRNAAKRLRQKKYRDDKQADEFEEGHRTLPQIDSERYTERKGLEGPMRARNGKVVYYDPKEGQYYDPDTDIYISNDEWEGMNESSPAPDGPDYKQGDLVVMPDGRSYTLDEYDDGIWWAVDNDGGDIEFEPGTELHHEPMSESEDDNVVSALDTMRTHLHDYEHDPSDRWEKYNQYRNQRKQISQRAKDLK